jgi:hypothetical protein
VLIDDGLLRLKLVHLKTSDEWKTVVNIIEKIYMGVGLKISWDKTFVSQVLCQYLNRVFYDGVEVTPGAKAYMRIGLPTDTAIPNMADDIASLSGSTRGAIKSGSDHRLAYLCYSFEVYLMIRRWSGYKLDLKKSALLPFMAFVPVGLGGLGISTLVGLSTNESYVSINTGLANMKLICHRFPKYAPIANLILNAGVRSMSDETLLRAPFSLRTKYRCLNTRRFANAAKEHVISQAVNPFLKSIVKAYKDGYDDFAVMTIASQKVVNELQRQKLEKMSMTTFLDKLIGKLQTSDTAAKVIGPYRCAAITLVNKSEAKVLLTEIVNGKFVMRSN